jgi:hypothetical protein
VLVVLGARGLDDWVLGSLPDRRRHRRRKPVGERGMPGEDAACPSTGRRRGGLLAVLADAADPRYAHTSHLHVRVAGRWSSTSTCEVRGG